MTEILAQPSDQPGPSSGRSHQELPRFKRAPLKNDLPELTELQPWKSLLAIACEWSIIAASVAAALHFNHWLVYLVAIIVIGTRQQALGILMHEGAHYRITLNKFLNDLISDLFLTYPVGLSIAAYRRMHLNHHRHTSSELDQDWRLSHSGKYWYWPKTRRNAIKTVLANLAGLNGHRVLLFINLWSSWTHLFEKRGSENMCLGFIKSCWLRCMLLSLRFLRSRISGVHSCCFGFCQKSRYSTQYSVSEAYPSIWQHQ